MLVIKQLLNMETSSYQQLFGYPNILQNTFSVFGELSL